MTEMEGEYLHVYGNSGKKVHLIRNGTATTNCGIRLYYPVKMLIANGPVTCKKCKSGCQTTHGMGRIPKRRVEK